MSNEEFAQIVAENTSVASVLDSLGFSSASGWMAKIVKDRILRDRVDISHFNHGGGGDGHPKYDLKEILQDNSPYKNIGRLKVRLVQEGLLEYKCAECSNVGEWNGRPLTLQLEHKNGKHNDHRLSNLCFLCPNCHSQTETYAGKNARSSKTWIDQYNENTLTQQNEFN
jgi:5-methylcytosine-specific restriction endonuclease McrA